VGLEISGYSWVSWDSRKTRNRNVAKNKKGAQMESNNDKKLKQNYHNSDILISVTVFFHF